MEIGEKTTRRLILRPWKNGDRAAFYDMNSNPDVMEFFPSVLDKEQSDELFQRIQSHWDTRGFGLWALEERHSGSFVGFAGLSETPFQAFFTPCVEVGWRLARPFWGRGYGAEAATQALEVGFVDLGLKEIFSFTSVDNHRSEKLMVRLGMKKVGEFDHPWIPTEAPLCRHLLYRIESPWGKLESISLQEPTSGL